MYPYPLFRIYNEQNEQITFDAPTLQDFNTVMTVAQRQKQSFGSSKLRVTYVRSPEEQEHYCYVMV